MHPTSPSAPARQPARFDMAGKKPRLSDDTLTDALRRFAAQRQGRPFTMKDFQQWPHRPCQPQTLILRFGSWREVLRRAGIQGGRPHTWSNQELLEHLSDLWLTLGRRPRAAELRKHGKPCPTAYYHRWGSVYRACEALARYHRAEISWEEALRTTPRRPRREALSKRLRWRILTRDGHRCVACGACPFEDRSVKLHIDHILPVSRGGATEEPNLRVLCSACNHGKAARLPGEAA